MEPKQQPPYPLRIAPELREKLEKEAANSKRSLNAEIAARLEQSFAAADRDTASVVVSLANAERQAAMSEIMLSAAIYSHAFTAASLLEIFIEEPKTCEALFGAEEVALLRAEAQAAIEAAEARDLEFSVEELRQRANEAGERLAAAKETLRLAATREVPATAGTRKRITLVGNIGSGRASAYDKVIIPAEIPRPMTNRGPTRSSNARKPKS